MPLTDNDGQSIVYSTLTDPPNAQTLGENIVNGVADKLVMRFPSASVRGATLTNPVPGMHTYLIDEQAEEYFDGQAWQRIVASKLPWANVTLASGYTSAADALGHNTVAPRVRREGSIVYMEGRMAKTGGDSFNNDSAGDFYATIPAGYQPVGHYAETMVRFTSGAVGAAEIWPGSSNTHPGGVKIWIPSSGTTYVGFSAWWFVN